MSGLWSRRRLSKAVAVMPRGFHVTLGTYASRFFRLSSITRAPYRKVIVSPGQRLHAASR